MATQDARLSKFEADFKQQQSEMTNKIDTVLKAIIDRLAGSLPSNTVKNPKLNTSLVLSAHSYPTIDPQCSSHPSTSVINMKKDHETPLLVGRGFLATANAVIDCRMAKIVVGEGITRSVFSVKGVNLGEEEVPYWTTLGKGRKAHLLEDKQIPSVGVFDEVFRTWMAFGGNTLVGDDVAGIKRCRRDLYIDGIRNLATASGRGRLKVDLKSSTWRRR
ncbi:hypothetical protein Tco_0635029 [Tanacetum coccineum]